MATKCDFRPEFSLTDDIALSLANAAFDADPDDLTDWLVLSDRLEEIGHGSAEWVRWGCRLWALTATVTAGEETWTQQECYDALSVATKDNASWRMVCAFGCLLMWHGPSAADGKKMGRTWMDARIRATQRALWCWIVGLCGDDAWGQADAAWKQAHAAWGQATAAGEQAYAVWGQATAAWNQAWAARDQAWAAENLAYAAGNMAYAAREQVFAAERQAFWKYAAALWRVVSANPPPMGNG